MNMTHINYKKYRKWFIPIAGLSLFWTIFGAITTDYRWWWLSFISVTFSCFTLNLFKGDIIQRPVMHQRVRFFLGSLSITSMMFILLACFISLGWLVGLMIVVIFLGTWASFSVDTDENLLPMKEKQIITYSSLGFFLILMGLFLIPSYVANSHKNPKSHFNTYAAVESYLIYGDVSPKNQEHIIARDWYKNSTENFQNDYVNVIWSNEKANNYRQNRKFANLNIKNATAIDDKGTIVGYRNNDYFMPLDDYKGDVARIVIYMYVTYKDDGLNLEYIDLNLMKQWSKLDPVDQKEIARNKLILQKYGYQNKFVSNPWLINFVI